LQIEEQTKTMSARSTKRQPPAARDDLSFDEFHAVRQRKRIDPGVGDAAEDSAPKKVDAPEPSYSVRETVGDFVEKFEVQLVVIILISLDVIAVTAEFFIAHSDGLVDMEAPQVVTATQLMQSFMGFTIFFFLMEIGLVFFAFSELCLSHFGYMLDLALVCGGLYWEINMASKIVRLFGILRVWRVVRLVNSLLATAEAKHEDTRQLLLQEQKQVEQMQADKANMEEVLKQEAAARQRVDSMLQGYKDEVETLSEALNIAAINAAQTRLLDDEDFLNELEGRESEEEDDGIDDEGFSEASGVTEKSTFVVSKDGSFQSFGQ
jgi:hypothetical protein